MGERKRIMVVDDSILILKMVGDTLKQNYEVYLYESASMAVQSLDRIKPSLVILDIEMPNMNGYEFVKSMKDNGKLQGIPVIFLTSYSDIATESKGFEIGVVDFITKPFVPETLLCRIGLHIELQEYRNNLEELVQMKTATIEKMQDTIVTALAELVECRDGETGGHLRRTAMYLKTFVEAMVEQNVYVELMPDNYVKDLIRSAPLHDIGKIGINDSALLKNGVLDTDEYNYMKQHTILGEKAFDSMIEQCEENNFLFVAKDLAVSHHERWDGTGYPHGLQGKDIPLCGRIMAICDVYDAITSKRCYKKAVSHSEAVKIISDASGSQFEPKLVNVFLSIEKEFEKICLQNN